MHPDYNDVQERFQDIREQLGDQTIIDALTGYLPTDDVPEYNLWDFADWLERLYL